MTISQAYLKTAFLKDALFFDELATRSGDTPPGREAVQIESSGPSDGNTGSWSSGPFGQATPDLMLINGDGDLVHGAGKGAKHPSSSGSGTPTPTPSPTPSPTPTPTPTPGIVTIGSSGGLVFNISFDSSVSSAPAGFTTLVEDVALFYTHELNNPTTVNLDVGWGEVNGQTLGSALGSSMSYIDGSFSYSQIKSALAATGSTSSDDQQALASLPGTDPTGGGNFLVTSAQAKALGLQGASSALDGYMGFSSSVPWTLDPNNRAVAGEYDLFGTVAHEISEVMGRYAFLGSTEGGVANSYAVSDLFRYSAPGVRQLSAGQTAYLSSNGGTTNLGTFNTNSGGDLGDWASSAGNDSFLAYSASGTENFVSENDLRTMDTIGWNTTAPYSTSSFSADGSTLSAGAAGSLVNSFGTWSFSTTTGAGGNMVLVNGQSAAAGSAIELAVANGGNIYADTSAGQWYEWMGSSWTGTTPPILLT